VKVRPSIPREKYRAVRRQDLSDLPQFRHLSREDRIAMLAVSAVLPFRTNYYVIEELINWDDIPDDPIYQLTFPQRGMLDPDDFRRMADLVTRQADPKQIKAAARDIVYRMNPHPAGQRQHNVPSYQGESIPGMQHKYGDTVLYFPSQGQTCHAYCTYCFRWAQFIGIEELKFRSNETDLLHAYLREHTEASDILFTGGDPMTMRTRLLRNYIEPLLEPGFEHIRQIRIGTKAVAYWPHRFVSDADADDFLRLLEEIRAAGKLPAIMAHYSHPVELSTRISREAVRRIQDAGGVLRSQSPLVRHVNDSSSIWHGLWKTQIALGIIPYYMFVERDTGPKEYFEVPLARALRIYKRAYRRLSGLARTVRGPVMSAMPGKVLLTGTADIHGEKVFVLHLLRGRKPEWERRPFFAHYDDEATWLTDLEPALGEREFFFEPDLRELIRTSSRRPRPRGEKPLFADHPDRLELHREL